MGGRGEYVKLLNVPLRERRMGERVRNVTLHTCSVNFFIINADPKGFFLPISLLQIS
jgi:hypothetical protein